MKNNTEKKHVQNRIGKQLILLIISTIFLLTTEDGFGQLGFFEDYWKPKSAVVPDYELESLPGILPQSIISVNMSDTIAKISPYVGGYNSNTYFGENVFDQSELMRHIKNLDLPVFRYPGGSGSMWYFWDHARPNLPDSVDYLTIKGETFHISEKIRWGDRPGDDYLSLDKSYILRDSLNNEATHVVNYAYARYGRSVDPVAQAAHYAADWVRYDNGRTKFWEIGNENYGAWEPSWIIDTARNLDGQPRMITGTLYGEHCLVFLDSMRAAAAEIGVDIKIGATLGFQETRQEWDVDVIKVLKDQVDFYIVHKYFGNDQDAEPDELFASIDEFYQHKAHVDNLIHLYSPSYVPLILTEWNTRYSGSKQNVSCANGMHTLLGFKAIINEGIGLSAKWNLIWGYQDGNTHGLISNEKDDPAVEGIPIYFPRAPFMYQYYFKKFLGDVSTGNQYDENEDIDVFSSGFSSGHAGVTIVNKGAEIKRVAINLENFDYGDRFYWYSLTPDQHEIYSAKVRVNGQTNNYPAGGPLNYEDILAYSNGIGEGIRLELEPYSATYILAEGNVRQRTDLFDITFQLKSRKEEVISTLANATVQIGSKLYITNQAGEVTIPVEAGQLDYQLMANGHDTSTGSVEVSESMLIADTLDYANYEVAFELKDADTQQGITNCEVSLGQETQQVSAEGIVGFSQVNFGTYQLEINSKAYKDTLTIDIFSDTLISLAVEKSVYQLQFLVSDRITGEELSNAKVTFNNTIKYTSLLGEATFTATYGNYAYSIEVPSYTSVNGDLELLNDTTVTAEINQSEANIKFRIYKGSSLLNGADVSLNGVTKQTNAVGTANYYDSETQISYAYSVSHEQYGEMTGTFILNVDTTITLNFAEENEVIISFMITDEGSAIEGVTVGMNSETKSTNSSGLSIFNKVGINQEYGYLIEADGYETFESAIFAARDSTVEIDLTSTLLELGSRKPYRIYPQPAAGFFVIENETGIRDILLFDMNGRKLEVSYSIRNRFCRVEIPGLEPGFYMVKILDERDREYNAKILISAK